MSSLNYVQCDACSLTSRFDNHRPICAKCKGCSPINTCKTCKPWPLARWENVMEVPPGSYARCGTCSSVRNVALDTHAGACVYCTGCTKLAPCPTCQDWPADTWEELGFRGNFTASIAEHETEVMMNTTAIEGLPEKCYWCKRFRNKMDKHEGLCVRCQPCTPAKTCRVCANWTMAFWKKFKPDDVRAFQEGPNSPWSQRGCKDKCAVCKKTRNKVDKHEGKCVRCWPCVPGDTCSVCHTWSLNFWSRFKLAEVIKYKERMGLPLTAPVYKERTGLPLTAASPAPSSAGSEADDSQDVLIVPEPMDTTDSHPSGEPPPLPPPIDVDAGDIMNVINIVPVDDSDDETEATPSVSTPQPTIQTPGTYCGYPLGANYAPIHRITGTKSPVSAATVVPAISPPVLQQHGTYHTSQLNAPGRNSPASQALTNRTRVNIQTAPGLRITRIGEVGALQQTGQQHAGMQQTGPQLTGPQQTGPQLTGPQQTRLQQTRTHPSLQQLARPPATSTQTAAASSASVRSSDVVDLTSETIQLPSGVKVTYAAPSRVAALRALDVTSKATDAAPRMPEAASRTPDVSRRTHGPAKKTPDPAKKTPDPAKKTSDPLAKPHQKHWKTILNAMTNDNIGMLGLRKQTADLNPDGSFKYVFQCNFCVAFVSSLENLMDHIQRHVFVCAVCGFQSFLRSKIVGHSLSKHPDTRYNVENLDVVKLNETNVNKDGQAQGLEQLINFVPVKHSLDMLDNSYSSLSTQPQLPTVCSNAASATTCNSQALHPTNGATSIVAVAPKKKKVPTATLR